MYVIYWCHNVSPGHGGRGSEACGGGGGEANLWPSWDRIPSYPYKAGKVAQHTHWPPVQPFRSSL
jgi:hypothetical protein